MIFNHSVDSVHRQALSKQTLNFNYSLDDMNHTHKINVRLSSLRMFLESAGSLKTLAVNLLTAITGVLWLLLISSHNIFKNIYLLQF